MAIQPSGDWISYSSRRTQAYAFPAELELRYRPVGERYEAAEGTLDHWLTERYCLYTLDQHERPLRGEIHHPPWPLQPAEATIARNTMGAEVDVLLDGEPLLHYADRQDVVLWALRPLS